MSFVCRYPPTAILCVLITFMLLSGCNQKQSTFVSTSKQQFTLSSDVDAIRASEIEKQGMQKIVSEKLLWPPIGDNEFEANYIVKFDNKQMFYDAGLSDDNVKAVEDSYSYYCNTNKVPTSDVELISVTMNKDDGLCSTIIETAGTQLEQILEVSSNYQRVDYIEGDEIMNTFGVLYVNMDGGTKERTTNLFNRYMEDGEQCQLYSMKEYNCCYYYFYTDADNENRYIRVEKKSNEIVDDGLWDENGIIKKEEKENE